LILLGWFLALCGLFFSQDLSRWLYLGLVCMLLAGSLILYHTGGQTRRWGKAVRLPFILFSQALPIVAVLFLLFPRNYGGFRFTFSRGALGSTGMSDRVEPGSIANLAYNHDVAFRVDFPDGNTPSVAGMYWRGGVLWRGDGLTWTQGMPMTTSTPGDRSSGESIRQRIQVEPHGGRWLFALDRPVSEVQGANYHAGGYLQNHRPLYTRKLYEVTSRSVPRPEPLYAGERGASLQKPSRVAPRVLELVDSWRDNAANDQEVVEQALKWFRREKFVYSLDPGNYRGDALDEFLFVRRSGFCEHYAGSFATLMRLAGIPARLVIGYHGGEFNRYYVIVRQSDAHAWAEVWIKDAGWVRVDPTTVIAPDRLTSGLESYLQRQAAADTGGDDDASTGIAGLREIMRDARLAWDSVSFQWDQRVLNFDEDNQRTFLASLGLMKYDWPTLLTWVILLIAVLMASLALWTRRPGGWKKDAARGPYARFCRVLAAQGVPREPWEGPIGYGERAALRLPHAAAAIRHVSELYAQLRYSPRSMSSNELAAAVRALRKLRPPRPDNATQPPEEKSSWESTLKQ
jgi:transglutaminase-like putative cysteine protease